MFKSIRHLTLIGGCMLLLAVTIASCSSAVKDEPATLGKAIEKVLAHGELKDNSNQKKVSFRSGTFQYCVIVDTKDSTITTARAGLFNIELECWSVDTRTGKLKSFLNKDFLFLSSDKSIPEQKQLRQHFEDAQNNVVKLICEKFGPPLVISCGVGYSINPASESLVGFFINPTNQTNFILPCK